MLVSMISEKLLTNGRNNSIYETLPERNLGVSGRGTYGYDSRYFMEFAFGYNGSEKFDSDRAFGFFPSVGLGWVVSNEPFWKIFFNKLQAAGEAIHHSTTSKIEHLGKHVEQDRSE